MVIPAEILGMILLSNILRYPPKIEITLNKLVEGVLVFSILNAWGGYILCWLWIVLKLFNRKCTSLAPCAFFHWLALPSLKLLHMYIYITSRKQKREKNIMNMVKASEKTIATTNTTTEAKEATSNNKNRRIRL